MINDLIITERDGTLGPVARVGAHAHLKQKRKILLLLITLLVNYYSYFSNR